MESTLCSNSPVIKRKQCSASDDGVGVVRDHRGLRHLDLPLLEEEEQLEVVALLLHHALVLLQLALDRQELVLRSLRSGEGAFMYTCIVFILQLCRRCNQAYVSVLHNVESLLNTHLKMCRS